MMRRGVGLYVLGLLCFHSSVLGQEGLEDGPRRPVFCNSLPVQKAVSSSLDHFNDQLVVGNKMALYQVLSATEMNSTLGSVYFLEFNIRPSDCPTESKLSWTECDYLSDASVPMAAVPCNATVLMTSTEISTQEIHCQIEKQVERVKAPCLGCTQDVDLDSEELRVPLVVSIKRFNSISDSTHLFTFNSIGQASRQVVAGFRYRLVFDMRKSNCSKAEHQGLSKVCHSDPEDVELANCNSTVDVAPWRHEKPEPNVECGPGPLPSVMLVNRRRPPGWSPLRNIFDVVEPTVSSPAAKEESSEEETGTANQAVADSCPSKPWKRFQVVQPDPSLAPTDAGSPVPTVEGAFRDSDLLG